MINLKVLIVYPKLAERIKKYLPEDIQIVTPETGTDNELKKLAGDVEVILATRLSGEVVKSAPKLKLLQKTGAGVDDMPFEELGEDVLVANTSGSNPTPLAEGAVALVLSLAKQVINKHKGFRDGRSGLRGIQLKGKNASIIGYGSIGSEVGRLLNAFGMDIFGIKRHPDEDLRKKMGLEFLGGPDDLNYVLSKSDFVVVTAPLTPDTRGMIGEKELKKMKTSAYIVNVARAGLIQQEPLYTALKDGWIAGAALDVWWTPHWWDHIWNPEGNDAADYPFWELDNVICTPHNIGFTDSRSDEGIKIMAKNILRIKEGKPPINQVNKELQY